MKTLKSNSIPLLVIFCSVIFLLVSVLPATSKEVKEEVSTLPSIFNGKNLEGWNVPEGNICWKVEDEILKVRSGPEKKGSSLWTEKEYTDS